MPAVENGGYSGPKFANFVGGCYMSLPDHGQSIGAAPLMSQDPSLVRMPSPLGALSGNAPLVCIALFVAFSAWTIHSWARLRHIPGPFLAKFTNLSRMWWVYNRRAHEIHINLHRKYGRLVRMGPNMVSVSDPNEVQNIYRMKGVLQKVFHNLHTIGLPAERSLMEKTVRLLPRHPPHVQGQDPARLVRNAG